MKYIVSLEYLDGRDLQFIAERGGDPGRTCVIENAKRYNSMFSAMFGLANAREYRDYPSARIIREPLA